MRSVLAPAPHPDSTSGLSSVTREDSFLRNTNDIEINQEYFEVKVNFYFMIILDIHVDIIKKQNCIGTDMNKIIIKRKQTATNNQIGDSRNIHHNSQKHLKIFALNIFAALYQKPKPTLRFKHANVLAGAKLFYLISFQSTYFFLKTNSIFFKGISKAI